MKKIIIIGVLLVVAVLVGQKYFKKEEVTKDGFNEIAKTSQVGEGRTVTATEKPVFEDGVVSENNELYGEYEDYDPVDASNDAQSGKVVLFFKASWCPTCKAVDKDINIHIKDIPKGLVIMKVDYDKYTELKKKYGVTIQHTFVQIDKDGNMLNKWLGSSTLKEIISKVK